MHWHFSPQRTVVGAHTTTLLASMYMTNAVLVRLHRLLSTSKPLAASWLHVEQGVVSEGGTSSCRTQAFGIKVMHRSRTLAGFCSQHRPCPLSIVTN